MRALLVTVALIVGSVASANPTPASSDAKITDGHVAWFDLSTTSMAKSKAFYGKLFGWTFTPLPGTKLAVTIASGGEDVGSLRVSEGAISAFNGVVYIAVADIMSSCKKATALGGTIPPGFPFNVGRKGAIALVTDPVGHPIGMFSKTPVPEKPEAKAPAK